MTGSAMLKNKYNIVFLEYIKHHQEGNSISNYIDIKKEEKFEADAQGVIRRNYQTKSKWDTVISRSRQSRSIWNLSANTKKTV